MNWLVTILLLWAVCGANANFLGQDGRNDPKRQFTTKPNTPGIRLNQYGDLRSYASKTLKMEWMGINQQATGIYGMADQPFKIYVDAGENDKLPFIAFSQVSGHYSIFKMPFQLNRGLNEFTFPIMASYLLTDPKVSLGGPIYIENPYTPSEQPSGVTIYIEGGDFFPIFRKGDNEEEYNTQLKQYYENLDLSTQFNLTEFEGDHVLFTIPAGSAYKAYITEKKSVKQNLANWDNGIRQLLEFDGVQFNKNEPHYSPLNEHLSINIRMAQRFQSASAFAYIDHIGIFREDWFDVAAYSEHVQWGFAHEIGHTMDISERVVTEATNNVIAKFEEVVGRKRETIFGNYEGIKNALTPELELKGVYWKNNRMDFLLWWLIESYYPGYWGKLDNMYRFDKTDVSGLTATEKQVYFSSLVVGIDLSYYFEKIGYSLKTTDPAFTKAYSSEKFKTLLNDAIASGKVKADVQPPIWYIDDLQYTHKVNGEKLSAYSSTQVIDPLSIQRTVSGSNQQFTLQLPKPTNEIAHLGYEISKKNAYGQYNVIAFVRSTVYKDPTLYPSDTFPTYTIKAYDRTFQSTAQSKPITVSNDKKVKLGNQYYYSVKEAVAAASNNDVVILLGDVTETYILVNKNITVKADDSISKATIYRGTMGPIFQVQGGFKLTIKDPKIVIDGSNISQIGQVVYLLSKATVDLADITIQNNINTNDGGAIAGMGSSSVYVNLSNVTFKNNRGKNGGVIYCNSFYGTITDNGSKYIGNSAAVSGGAIYSKCKGSFTGSHFEGNSAASNGGAFDVIGGTTILDSAIIENKAKYGGGFYYEPINFTSDLEIRNSKVLRNEADLNGGDLYIKFNYSRVNIYNCQFTEGFKRLLSQQKLQGIYIEQGNVEIEGELPLIETKEDQEITFSQTGSDILLSGFGSEVTFKVKSTNLSKVVNNNQVFINFLDATGNTKNLILNKNTKYKLSKILPSSVSVGANHYIAYVDSNTNEYSDDDEVEFNQSLSFEAKVMEKIKVTFDDSKNKREQYFKKNEKLVLPGVQQEAIPQDQLFEGWVINDTVYKPNQEIAVTESFEVKAKFSVKSVEIGTKEGGKEDGKGTVKDTEEAIKEDTKNSNLIIIIPLVCGAIVILVGVVFFLIKRRKDSDEQIPMNPMTQLQEMKEESG